MDISPTSAIKIITPHSESVGTLTPETNGAQTGAVIVFASVVTVPPNARALPSKFAKCPIVIPAASRIFPTNVGAAAGTPPMVYAPIVVAPPGAQNTSEAQ